jgi:DNA mismatch repair ATPase MutS
MIYGLDIIPVNTFLFLLVTLNICHYLIGRQIIAEFGMLLNIEQEMAGLYKQLKLVEGLSSKSKKIESLKERLKPDQYGSASDSIKDFNMILKRINWRSNLLINSILQLFLFWDLRLILLLKQWKKKNEFYVGEWISVIAETEVLISLASLVHNNPEWSFPKVDDRYFHLTAQAVGHPLIPPDKRICNDFKMDGRGTVALITGSNMAGKSTFLRTLGINIILAQTGAPVCAQYLELGRMNLISSMRVADNLAENTSTFYAELKKLQGIIEAVNKKEEVMILLDEVLRGTNSADRHRGTQALIRQLLHNTVVTVMATHDTDLAQSEALIDPSVYNYHFEGRIIEDELYFDYKIRKGICESFNATTLMKKIGIHFQD